MATDTIRSGLRELREVSQNPPPQGATRQEYEAWGRQAALAVTYVANGGKIGLGIENVPPSCMVAHRQLVDVARRAVTFSETYIGNVRDIATGNGSAQVEQKAQELEASLQQFDVELLRL